MSVLEDLRSHYSEVRRRLNPPPTPIKKPSAVLVVDNPQPSTPPTTKRHRWFRIIAEPGVSRPPRVGEILCVVSNHFNVHADEIRSHRRTAKLSRPRHIAMWLAKNMTMQSLPEIGMRFGRDHTTIIHSIKKIERLRAENQELADTLESIRSAVTALVESDNE